MIFSFPLLTNISLLMVLHVIINHILVVSCGLMELGVGQWVYSAFPGNWLLIRDSEVCMIMSFALRDC